MVVRQFMGRHRNHVHTRGIAMSDETERRLATLESDYRHMSRKVDDMSEKIDEMHELLLKARGAKWVIVGLATLGGFVSAKLGALTGIFWFPGK